MPINYMQAMNISPEELSKRVQPEDLVAVHMTDYFPKEGIIKCLNSNFPGEILRLTTHFSLNHPVAPVLNIGIHSWDNRRYAIISPLNKLAEINPLRNFLPQDTYFLGDVDLPEGTKILIGNCNYPSKKEIDSLKSKGISWSISGNVKEDVKKNISKMGYSQMFKELNLSRSDYERICEQLGGQRTSCHERDRLYDGLEKQSIGFSNCTNPKHWMNQHLMAYLKNPQKAKIFRQGDFNFGGEGWRESEGEQVFEGFFRDLKSMRKTKKELPDFLQTKVDYFLEVNQKKMCSILPDNFREYSCMAYHFD